MRSWNVVLVTLAMLAIALPACAEQAASADAGVTDLAMAAQEKGATEAACTATAYCEAAGIWVSCSGETNCYAQDQDCEAHINGIVICDNDDQFCPPCPIDCTGYPPMGKCIDGWSCKSGCNNCGDGSCIRGECNCLA